MRVVEESELCLGLHEKHFLQHQEMQQTEYSREFSVVFHGNADEPPDVSA
jgi:hypothetical protein